MIVNITMQNTSGDCPSNIVVDVEKLKAITLDNCIEYYKKYKNIDKRTKLKFAKERFEDIQRYIKIITREKINDDIDIPNPTCWDVLEEAEVNLPQMVDSTMVIFYE
jgi:hypothetical protein